MKNSLNISLKQYVNLQQQKKYDNNNKWKTLVADGIIYGQCL